MSTTAVDRHEGLHAHLFGRDYRWHQTPRVTHTPTGRRRVTWRWSLLPETPTELAERLAEQA